MKTFSERVVQAALSIPRGRVTTYGRVAVSAGGSTISSQSITAILSKAYKAGQTNIPFHRIVYADGRIWIDEKHRKERLKLYREEGIEIDDKDKVKDFYNKLFKFI